MKLKQLAYWILTAFICLCIMDATLRLYFHPTDSRYPLAIIHAFHIAKNNILYKITPEKPIGIWEGDPRFGYSHIANSIGTHETPDIDNRELELTSKFLGTMNELCLEHNIRFIVVILRQGKLPDAIYKSLSDDKIQTLDLSELKFSVDEHDKHPDRNGPKQIADAIYASFIVSAR